MAWPISISQEGWQEIHEALEKWSNEDLIKAIVDDMYDRMKDCGVPGWICDMAHEAYAESLEDLAGDILVDRAFELIEENDTCDNGGWAYWIDRKGYHKVRLPDHRTEE